MIDQDLFDICEEYIKDSWGTPPTAYSINDDGTKTEVKMGYYVLIKDSDMVFLDYLSHDHTIASRISFHPFTLESMLETVGEQRGSTKHINELLN